MSTIKRLARKIIETVPGKYTGPVKHEIFEDDGGELYDVAPSFIHIVDYANFSGRLFVLKKLPKNGIWIYQIYRVDPLDMKTVNKNYKHNTNGFLTRIDSNRQFVLHRTHSEDQTFIASGIVNS